MHVVVYVLVIALPIEFAEEIMFVADVFGVHHDKCEYVDSGYELANYLECIMN